MRVVILSAEGARVEFATDHGRGRGTWVGAAAEVGRIYDVELDAKATLTWGQELLARPEGPPRIEPRGQLGALVDATLELHDPEDGAAWLRIGPSLMAVDTRGAAPAPGSPVRALFDALLLFDTGT